MKKARSMKVVVGLSKNFWDEVVATTNYLTTRPPTSVLDDKILKEIWCREKPFVSHLKVFVCEAYMHVPKVNKKNLDNKPISASLFGIQKESSATSCGLHLSIAIPTVGM
jgi:hypothetical protein